MRLVPALDRERHAARVLEVGQRVDELGARPQLGLDLVGQHPVVVHRHAGVLGLIGAPRLEGAQVGRPLDEQMIAGIDEDLADEIERLLRAAREEDVVGVDPHAQAAGVPRDHLAQGPVALGGAVLQRAAAVLFEDPVARLAKLLDGKDLGRRQPTAEGNDVGLLGELQQLADGGTAHASYPLREAFGPACLHRTPPAAPDAASGLTIAGFPALRPRNPRGRSRFRSSSLASLEPAQADCRAAKRIRGTRDSRYHVPSAAGCDPSPGVRYLCAAGGGSV